MGPKAKAKAKSSNAPKRFKPEEYEEQSKKEHGERIKWLDAKGRLGIRIQDTEFYANCKRIPYPPVKWHPCMCGTVMMEEHYDTHAEYCKLASDDFPDDGICLVCRCNKFYVWLPKSGIVCREVVEDAIRHHCEISRPRNPNVRSWQGHNCPYCGMCPGKARKQKGYGYIDGHLRYYHAFRPELWKMCEKSNGSISTKAIFTDEDRRLNKLSAKATIELTRIRVKERNAGGMILIWNVRGGTTIANDLMAVLRWANVTPHFLILLELHGSYDHFRVDGLTYHRLSYYKRRKENDGSVGIYFLSTIAHLFELIHQKSDAETVPKDVKEDKFIRKVEHRAEYAAALIKMRDNDQKYALEAGYYAHGIQKSTEVKKVVLTKSPEVITIKAHDANFQGPWSPRPAKNQKPKMEYWESVAGFEFLGNKEVTRPPTTGSATATSPDVIWVKKEHKELLHRVVLLPQRGKTFVIKGKQPSDHAPMLISIDDMFKRSISSSANTRRRGLKKSFKVPKDFHQQKKRWKKELEQGFKSEIDEIAKKSESLFAEWKRILYVVDSTPEHASMREVHSVAKRNDKFQKSLVKHLEETSNLIRSMGKSIWSFGIPKGPATEKETEMRQEFETRNVLAEIDIYDDIRKETQATKIKAGPIVLLEEEEVAVEHDADEAEAEVKTMRRTEINDPEKIQAVMTEQLLTHPHRMADERFPAPDVRSLFWQSFKQREGHVPGACEITATNEVLCAREEMKNIHAVGPDQIPLALVIVLPLPLVTVIAHIIDMSSYRGTPKGWHLFSLLQPMIEELGQMLTNPMWKGKGSPLVRNFYRGIGKINVICQLKGVVLRSRKRWRVPRDPSQFGFTRGKTIAMLIRQIIRILLGIIERESLAVTSFTDVVKAFDIYDRLREKAKTAEFDQETAIRSFHFTQGQSVKLIAGDLTDHQIQQLEWLKFSRGNVQGATYAPDDYSYGVAGLPGMVEDIMRRFPKTLMEFARFYADNLISIVESKLENVPAAAKALLRAVEEAGKKFKVLWSKSNFDTTESGQSKRKMSESNIMIFGATQKLLTEEVLLEGEVVEEIGKLRILGVWLPRNIHEKGAVMGFVNQRIGMARQYLIDLAYDDELVVGMWSKILYIVFFLGNFRHLLYAYKDIITEEEKKELDETALHALADAYYADPVPELWDITALPKPSDILNAKELAEPDLPWYPEEIDGQRVFINKIEWHEFFHTYKRRDILEMAGEEASYENSKEEKAQIILKKKSEFLSGQKGIHIFIDDSCSIETGRAAFAISIYDAAANSDHQMEAKRRKVLPKKWNKSVSNTSFWQQIGAETSSSPSSSTDSSSQSLSRPSPEGPSHSSSRSSSSSSSSSAASVSASASEADSLEDETQSEQESEASQVTSGSVSPASSESSSSLGVDIDVGETEVQEYCGAKLAAFESVLMKSHTKPQYASLLGVSFGLTEALRIAKAREKAERRRNGEYIPLMFHLDNDDAVGSFDKKSEDNESEIAKYIMRRIACEKETRQISVWHEPRESPQIAEVDGRARVTTNTIAGVDKYWERARAVVPLVRKIPIFQWKEIPEYFVRSVQLLYLAIEINLPRTKTKKLAFLPCHCWDEAVMMDETENVYHDKPKDILRRCKTFAEARKQVFEKEEFGEEEFNDMLWRWDPRIFEIAMLCLPKETTWRYKRGRSKLYQRENIDVRFTNWGIQTKRSHGWEEEKGEIAVCEEV